MWGLLKLCGLWQDWLGQVAAWRHATVLALAACLHVQKVKHKAKLGMFVRFKFALRRCMMPGEADAL